MRYSLLAFLAVLASSAAVAEPAQRTDVYGRNGERVGTMRTEGNRTDVYDANGRKVETQRRDGSLNRTDVYGRNGEKLRTYRDRSSSGR